MSVKHILKTGLLSFLIVQVVWAESIDHNVWSSLLKAHVSPVLGGKSTMVDYQGMARDRDQLEAYLRGLSEVEQSHFDRWSEHEQLAFLINAYNAWTVALILTAWPELDSIKELGGFFSTPWRKEFVVLLGKTRSLDDIEHGLIRGSERYRDPRIHFALNCASIGCPALRAQAYVGHSLDKQLNEQTKLFLSDHSRNRVEKGSLKLSSIFKWYQEDFEKGWLGFYRLEEFLASNADALALTPQWINKLKAGHVDIEFLEYDWQLNKKR
jgi:hypothetical protein